MRTNAKLSQVLMGVIGVVNTDITTDRTGDYHDVSGARRLLGQLVTGTVADGSNATIQLMQAKDASGTDAKELTSAVEAVSSGGEELLVEVDAEVAAMDTDFTHVAVKVTSNNGTAVPGAAVLNMGDLRFSD